MFAKQKMNGGEEDIWNGRPANVTRNGQEIVIIRNPPGECPIERTAIGQRFAGESLEPPRELRAVCVSRGLKRIARGPAPALCALPLHDCAAAHWS